MSLSTSRSTKSIASRWLLLGVSLVGAGCGSSPAPARDLQLQTSFVVEPGQERYECYRKNINEDVFVTKMSTSAAPGVHHQILAVADQSEPEGVSECTSVLLSVSQNWIFLANSSPLALALPTDVAYKVPAGSQLVLQTHLFNPSDVPVSSTLEVGLTGIAESEVVDLAQLVEAGTLNIDLPPAKETQVKGKCTLQQDVKVFGLLPHMHYLGTTFKAWIGDGTDAMLYDDKFFGDTQLFETFPPVAMPKGSPLNIECNYFNGSGERVIYGSSAKEEMCFGIAFYYPAIEGRSPLCVN